MVPGGIDHRREVVQVRGELLDPLADISIVFVKGGIPEQVGGNEDAHRRQLLAGLGQEARDGGEARVARVGLGVAGGAQLAVGGEADVVELDLVEALLRRFLGDRDGVVPDFLAEGIQPGQPLVVEPRLAGPRVDHRPLGLVVGQDAVLEDHDPGDRIDPPGLEVGQHLVELLDVDRPAGAGLPGQRDLGPVRDPAAVTLDVDDHTVQLGPVQQIEDAPPDPLVTHAVVGQVRGLDDLGVEGDGEGGDRRFQREAAVARGLHDQGVLRPADPEAPLGVRADFLRARVDRGARDRRLGVRVHHLPLNGLGRWPRLDRREEVGRGGSGGRAGGGDSRPRQ